MKKVNKIDNATFFADIKPPTKGNQRKNGLDADSWIVRKYDGMTGTWKKTSPKNRKKK